MKFEIAAVSYVSLSEIQIVMPWFTWEYLTEEDKKLDRRKELEQLLFDLGMNTRDYPYEVQYVQHRNKFNEVVKCERFVGLERLDSDWLKSGHASQEALDKAKGNKLLTDLYVKRGIFLNENDE